MTSSEKTIRKIGVITSGISYQYAKEVFGDASILRLGMVYPMPTKMLINFCSRVEKIYVIEELEPFIEEHLRIIGVRNSRGENGIFGKGSGGNPTVADGEIVRGLYLY